MGCDAFDVVVVPFPFTDRAASKRRPALVLSDASAFNAATGQVVLAMITSVIGIARNDARGLAGYGELQELVVSHVAARGTVSWMNRWRKSRVRIESSSDRTWGAPAPAQALTGCYRTGAGPRFSSLVTA